LSIAALVVVIDQVSKSLALAHLSKEPHHVFGPFGFELTYNTGSAFSLFESTTALLVVFDVALVIVLCIVGLRATSLLIQIGVGMILGGALGNMADRAFRHHGGGVVDFITLTHWPTFNAADSAITVGAIVLAVGLLRDSGSSAPMTEGT
jgi:signal peptidase II